jgi:hypothetical protein
MRENLEHVMHVTQVGNPVNYAPLVGQQRRRQDRKGGIFGSADSDRAHQTMTSMNNDFIHISR